MIISIVTSGKIHKVNHAAYDGLKGALIIHDVYVGLSKTVNPWVTFNRKSESTYVSAGGMLAATH